MGPLRLGVCLMVAIIVGWCPSGYGQIPVTDAGNLAVNTTTSIQAVITAVEAVLQTANQVLELTPVDEVIAAQGIADDMALLGEILASAEGLSYDIQSINAQITVLFDLETAPNTVEGLQERLREIKPVISQARTFAVRTQTLLTTVFHTIDHLIALLNSVGAFVGNMQGNQTLVQVNSTVSKTLAVQLMMNTSWQRTDIVERLSKDLVVESIQRIDYERLGSWKPQ